MADFREIVRNDEELKKKLYAHLQATIDVQVHQACRDFCQNLNEIILKAFNDFADENALPHLDLKANPEKYEEVKKKMQDIKQRLNTVIIEDFRASLKLKKQ